jgi:hypothetical protein
VANRVAGRALSHADFAEVLAAEVLSGVGSDDAHGEDRSGARDEEDGSGAREEQDARGAREAPHRAIEGAAREPRTSAPPTAPPLVVTTSPEAADLERDLDEADAFELDRRLRGAVGLEARGLARVARLLEDVVRWGLHRELGYRSVDAYAEERLGMAASRARALLRIGRAARACPPLREAFASGRLSWVAAHALLPLLLEAGAARHRAGWLAHAERVSVRRLGDDVAGALVSGSFAPPRLDPLPGGAAPVPDAGAARLQTGAITRLEKEDARLCFTAAPEVAHLLRAVLATVQRRLERIRGRPMRRSDALDAMLDHALATWEPERRRREDAVFERDGWRCTAPGCTSYRNLQQHHVVYRSRGGGDASSNLTTLCAWHHLRGVHGGVLRCTGAAPGRLRFELGVRAGRPPLAVYASGDVMSA